MLTDFLVAFSPFRSIELIMSAQCRHTGLPKIHDLYQREGWYLRFQENLRYQPGWAGFI